MQNKMQKWKFALWGQFQLRQQTHETSLGHVEFGHFECGMSTELLKPVLNNSGASSPLLWASSRPELDGVFTFFVYSLGVIIWCSVLSSLLVTITILLFPRFNFLTVKLLPYTSTTLPVSSVTLYCTSGMEIGKQTDGMSGFLFSFFFNDSYSFSAFAALCCLPNSEAATVLLPPVFFRSEWCGPGKLSMCHSWIQMPRI